MDNQREARIDDISKDLVEKFNALEITIDEFMNENKCVYEGLFEDVVKVYKIEDENIIQSLLSESEKSEIQITIDHLNKDNLMENSIDEVCSLYMTKISTGKLITIVLQSEDKISLSGFAMEGNGEILFEYLTNLIDGPIKKSINPLDELIEESKNFKPYGSYFK